MGEEEEVVSVTLALRSGRAKTLTYFRAVFEGGEEAVSDRYIDADLLAAYRELAADEDKAMHALKLGFTGTRDGMTDYQKDKFVQLILALKPKYFHHGLCIGADEQAHDLVREHLPGCWIVGHPCNIIKMRSDRKCDETRPVKDALDRDLDIVREVDILAAAPKSRKEELRSGTWTTVRYARKLAESGTQRKPEIKMVWP